MFPRLSAPRLIVLAFAGLILLGTLLLKIPAANNGISWTDAFFESVSAVTVTGLQAVVPAEDFTPLGQGILAVLIQLGGDRKSTRLNSSHANISYAVFCLKKKQHTPAHPNV